MSANSANKEPRPTFAPSGAVGTMPLLALAVAPSTVIFVLILFAVLHLSANFATRKVHGVDVGIGRVGAESCEHGPEIACSDVLARYGENVGRDNSTRNGSTRWWACRRP